MTKLRFTVRDMAIGHACLVVLFGVCFFIANIEASEFFSASLPPWTHAERISADGRSVLLNTSNGYALWDLSTDHVEPLPREFWARDLTGDGLVVVGNLQGGMGPDRPFRWTEDEGLASLDFGLNGNVLVTDISADGRTMVGRFYSDALSDSRPFRWSQQTGANIRILSPDLEWGQWTRVSADGRVVTGAYAVDGDAHAYRWTEATGAVELEGLEGRTNHRVIDLSDDGSVVVGSGWSELYDAESNTLKTVNQEAFRWTAATGVVGLGSLSDSGRSEARAVSSDGNLIIGVAYDSWNEEELIDQELFAWTATQGMVSLTDLIEDQLGIRLPQQSSVFGLSSDSRVVIGASEGTPPGAHNVDFLSYGWAVSFDRPLQELMRDTAVIGDFNGDGWVRVDDLDALAEAIIQATNSPRFDLDQSGGVGLDDLNWFVEVILGTWHGDANLDGEFNSSDLVAVFAAGQYEDGVLRNSTWASGDWNADQEFSSRDLVVVFQSGGYEQGPRNAHLSVPEPSTGILAVLAIGIWRLTSRRATDRRETLP